MSNTITTKQLEEELETLQTHKQKLYSAVVHAHNKGSGDAETRALNDRKLALLTKEVTTLGLYLQARKACDEAGI